MLILMAILFAMPSPLLAQALSGEKLFRNQCAACHSLVAGEVRVGPSLHGLAGRKAGTLAGFSYSPALRKARLRWKSDTLDKWLTDSGAFVPGSMMNFRQADAAKRAEIIAFLLENQSN
jgi:cytochrome c2